MRRRSNTLYADTIEDYTSKASTQNDIYNSKIRKPNSKKRANISSLFPIFFNEDKRKGSIEDMFACSGDPVSKKTEENGDQYWSNFDFDADKLQERSGSKLERSKFYTNNLKRQEESVCNTDSTEDTLCSSPDSLKKIITRKFMIIGLQGTGRHSLVNLIFDSQGKEGNSPLRQTMDLIIKTKKEACCEIKYQFWMRALDDHKFDGLINVYYRNATIFFFVYSVTDRKSFEVLNEAIESVLKEVPREKFVGILLGNKSDLKQHRKIRFDEGKALKDKYNLSLFLETHISDQESKDMLFLFVNKRV